MNRAAHGYDVVVIGVGGMGSAAAFHVARRAARSLERFDVPYEFGCSHGLSRIIRLAYSECPTKVSRGLGASTTHVDAHNRATNSRRSTPGSGLRYAPSSFSIKALQPTL
jgi:glycine/D-amino acid oxidase-like deaminating enzyme